MNVENNGQHKRNDGNPDDANPNPEDVKLTAMALGEIRDAAETARLKKVLEEDETRRREFLETAHLASMIRESVESDLPLAPGSLHDLVLANLEDSRSSSDRAKSERSPDARSTVSNQHPDEPHQDESGAIERMTVRPGSIEPAPGNWWRNKRTLTGFVTAMCVVILASIAYVQYQGRIGNPTNVARNERTDRDRSIRNSESADMLTDKSAQEFAGNADRAGSVDKFSADEIRQDGGIAAGKNWDGNDPLSTEHLADTEDRAEAGLEIQKAYQSGSASEGNRLQARRFQELKKQPNRLPGTADGKSDGGIAAGGGAGIDDTRKPAMAPSRNSPKAEFGRSGSGGGFGGAGFGGERSGTESLSRSRDGRGKLDSKLPSPGGLKSSQKSDGLVPGGGNPNSGENRSAENMAGGRAGYGQALPGEKLKKNRSVTPSSKPFVTPSKAASNGSANRFSPAKPRKTEGVQPLTNGKGNSGRGLFRHEKNQGGQASGSAPQSDSPQPDPAPTNPIVQSRMELNQSKKSPNGGAPKPVDQAGSASGSPIGGNGDLTPGSGRAFRGKRSEPNGQPQDKRPVPESTTRPDAPGKQNPVKDKDFQNVPSSQNKSGELKESDSIKNAGQDNNTGQDSNAGQEKSGPLEEGKNDDAKDQTDELAIADRKIHEIRVIDPALENDFVQPIGTNAISTFSIDTDTASYTNIRQKLRAGVLPDPEDVRIEEMINYLDFEYKQPAGNEPFAVDMELASSPWSPGNKILKIGLQARRIDNRNRPPSNLVFLVDVSGSMRGRKKLPLLKYGLKQMVQRLREDDYVAIVTYSNQIRTVLEPTDGSQKEKIIGVIDSLTAQGSTNGGEGLQRAYELAERNLLKNGTNRIVLGTDGDFNVGIQNDVELAKFVAEKARSGVFLTVCGFGSDNFKDQKMQLMAQNGNGKVFFIDSEQEAQRVFAERISGSLVTIAKDVKVQLLFNPRTVQSYRLIGYENRMLNAEDFDNDQRDAGEIDSGDHVTALYEIVPGSGDFAVPTSSSPGNEIDLKYQVVQERKVKLTELAKSNDIAALRIRFKPPTSDKSELREFTVQNNSRSYNRSSPEFKLATAVAGLGLMLRGSRHRGGLNYDNLREFGQTVLASVARPDAGQPKESEKTDATGKSATGKNGKNGAEKSATEKADVDTDQPNPSTKTDSKSNEVNRSARTRQQQAEEVMELINRAADLFQRSRR